VEKWMRGCITVDSWWRHALISRTSTLCTGVSQK